MMKTKRTLIILLVVLASLLMVAAVSADTIVGRGWIRAQGDGRAALQGDLGSVHLSGTGSLWYKDAGEVDTPEVTGEGFRIEYPNGWVQYTGFDGEFSINDADEFIVILHGEDVNLFAVGQGRVYLKGQGHYTIGSGSLVIRGTWSETGEALSLGADKVN